MAVTVLIVDDYEEFRHTARALLEAEGFQVIGEAADGASAMSEAARLRPRVVLLDIQLPDLDGFAVAKELAGRDAAPAVVLISSRGAGEYRRRLAAAPVCGFIPKAELSGRRLDELLR